MGAPGWGDYAASEEPATDTGAPPRERDPFDGDGDGFLGGDDCDDGAPDVFPGSVDFCGDGVDGDCDGVDPSCERAWIAGDLSLADPATLCARGNAVDGDLLLDVVTAADLAALDCLVEVTGDLVLTSSRGLATTRGLGSLERVGGDLRVERMHGLIAVEGLDRLEEVGGDLAIADSPIRRIGPLPRLDHIGGDLSWSGLSQLAEAPDLAALATLGGAVRFGVEGLGDLTRPPRLNNLSEAEAILVQTNRDLQVIDGFGGLRALRGDGPDAGRLELYNLGSLERISGFGRLEEVSEISLRFVGATRLEGFRRVTRLDVLSLEQTGTELDLRGLAGLTAVDDALVIRSYAPPSFGLPALVAVETLDIRNPRTADGLGWLPALARVAGDATLDGANLAELDGLPALAGVGGDLDLPSGLVTLSGLGALTAVGGDVVVDGPRSADLSGLRSLVEIGGELSIVGTTALPDLDGLGRLEALGGLRLDSNTALASLDGLAAPSRLGGDLVIVENTVLRDISALIPLEAVAGDVVVGGQSALPPSQVDALLDGLDVTGAVTRDD